jgi:formate dehydrogenase
LHKRARGNDVVIHPSDAAPLGVSTGDRVRVYSPSGSLELEAVVSEQPRVGVVIIDHGWGSRAFDPRGGASPTSYGVNRNQLVEGREVDPLSQQTALGSSYVAVERIA